MSDVFISYSRSIEPQARRIADALRGLGYSVWRDDELPAHRSYSEVTEERLRGAKAVVVIWSAEAVKSQWVRAEADVAREAGTLVQLSLDGATPPLPFNQIQCAEMAGWNGEMDWTGWKKVVASVAELTGGPRDGGSTRARPAPARGLSVCVLPFANMSGEAEQEYFSDGISEDIITDLSKVSALFVVARHTAFSLKGRSMDLPQLARQLNVSHVLEGSVRKSGDRVRITAQLIDGSTGGHVWAERYDRDLTDIFALQDEISQAIVKALRLKLLPDEKKAIERRGTDSAEAYNLYLMARQYLIGASTWDARASEAIMRLCRASTEIDPGYARAWALMAFAQSSERFLLGKPGDDGLAAAERALSLDPDLAEAHAVKAGYLKDSGRVDEADAEITLALTLDSESYDVNRTAGGVRFAQGRFEEAIRCYEKGVSLLEPELSCAVMLITCYRGAGDLEAAKRAARVAFERAEKAVAQDPSNGAIIGVGSVTLAVLGEAGRAREWAARALMIDPNNLNMRYNLGCGLCGYLGDVDGALEVLGPFFVKAPVALLNHARLDPDLDPMRGDARFQTLFAAAEARVAATGPTDKAG